ncbi:MAG: DsbA family protein [Solirubrobacterales bacterium]
MKAVIRLLALGLMLATGAARAADKVEANPLDQVLGNPNAPITMVEYASTTCGHCAAFHKETLPRIKAEWIDTGKAKLIYRDFPTGPAALSIGASMIAHCSGPQRYFGVLGMLFESQEKWLGSKNPLEELKRIVRLAGITGEQVDACLQRQDLAQAIQARAQEANQKAGIESTPTMVINGEKIVGAQAYDVYDKALKAAKK